MTDKPTIYEALSRVMAEVQAISKRDRNNEQGYNFRGIDAVVNAVGPALREHGVLVVPLVEDASWRDVLTVRDKKSRECTVRVRFRFYGPAGDHIDAVTPGESMDFGDKGAAKAMSVAFRIALLQALAIPTDEPEHDPDASSYERAERREPSLKARELYEQVGEAGTPEALRELFLAVNAAGKAGEVTGDEARQIKERITRRGELLAKPATNELPEQPAEPVEDRTAEQPDQPAEEPVDRPSIRAGQMSFDNGLAAEQQPMDADWPPAAKPGQGDPA